MSPGGYTQVAAFFLAPSPDKQVKQRRRVIIPILQMMGPLHGRNGGWLPGTKKKKQALSRLLQSRVNTAGG